ncbi:MAG: IS21 family transposase [Acidimicrobiia bacterium]
MLNVEEWAEIRRLHKSEGMGVKRVAHTLGISKNTVRRALRSDRPPRYLRERRPSAVDPFGPQIHLLLKGCPTMPATVIAERIGWQRGITILKERVAEIRPLYLPQDPYQRTDYQPGQLAQWDLWQPPVDIPIGFEAAARLWVVTGVTGYSRFSVGHMIPSRETHDVLSGHLECLKDLGAVPRQGIYDNEGAIGRNRGGKMEFTQAFSIFKGTLGMGAYILKGGFPEGKGVLERSHRYFETSFLPGRIFGSIDDFNSQFKNWLTSRANHRIHATIRCRPDERIAKDKGSMLALPPILPDTSFRTSTRIGRDHYIRYGTCDYSVHPKAIGRRVEIEADLSWVVARLGDEEVARHRRSLAPHRAVTDPVHGRARRQMKKDRGRPTDLPSDEVEERDLSIYDQAVGAQR